MLRPHEQRAFPLVMRYLVALSQGEEEVPNRRTVPYRDFVSSEGGIMIRRPAQKALLIYSLKNGCWSQTPTRRERLPCAARSAAARMATGQRVADREPRVPADAGPPGFKPQALAEPRKTKG